MIFLVVIVCIVLTSAFGHYLSLRKGTAQAVLNLEQQLFAYRGELAQAQIKSQQDSHMSVDFVNMLMDRLHAAEAKCVDLENAVEKSSLRQGLRLTASSNFLDFSDGVSLSWNLRTGIVMLRDDRIPRGTDNVRDMDDEHLDAVMFDHPVTYGLAHNTDAHSMIEPRHKLPYFFADGSCRVSLGSVDRPVTVRDFITSFASVKGNALTAYNEPLSTYFGLYRQQGNVGQQYLILLINPRT